MGERNPFGVPKTINPLILLDAHKTDKTGLKYLITTKIQPALCRLLIKFVYLEKQRHFRTEIENHEH